MNDQLYFAFFLLVGVFILTNHKKALGFKTAYMVGFMYLDGIGGGA